MEAEEQLAKQKLEKANEMKKERDVKLEEKFREINDPKKQGAVFKRKLGMY